jgi:hypothetical protein
MSNNKQQTAVELLEEKLKISFGNDLKPLRGFFVIAKEMEKKQIENAYQAGQDNVDYTACLVDEDGLKNYYNETYGGNK